LGLEYAVFVSTFHTVRFTLGATWKIPSLDLFIESLMHEQDKLIKMGEIKSSKVHALVVHESNKSNLKTKQKGKGKKDPEQRKEGNFKPFDESSSSKGGKGKKGKTKCGYCNHDYHPESSCMKKTIDLMVQTLQQNNLGDCIPENAKKKPGDKAPQNRGNSHALISIHSSPDAWILDSGASHHMEATKMSYHL
jgi:hypothetical protein